MRLQRYSWAINSRSHEGHGFIGVGYWSWDIPAQCDGNRTALFRTRQEARFALPRVKGAFPKAAVCRVSVTIEEVRQ